MKFCKDCIHCIDNKPWYICGVAPKLEDKIDIVTGETFPVFVPCFDYREDDNGCGIDAKYFVSREYK